MAVSDDPRENLHRAAEPAWERARRAVVDGDAETALAAIDESAHRTAGLQRYSINWITSLLSFIGEELGEAAVERALRRFGDTYLSTRRSPGWHELPAEVRAREIVRSMVANGADVEIHEEDDRIELAFRCGTGGRLIDEGAYEGEDAYLTLRERGPVTFDRDHLPVYCAHCSVNNEIQGIENTGYPMTVEYPPTEPGQRCVHHVYRDPGDLPAKVYARLGMPQPRTEEE